MTPLQQSAVPPDVLGMTTRTRTDDELEAAVRERIDDFGGVETTEERELVTSLFQSLLAQLPAAVPALLDAVRHGGPDLEQQAHRLRGAAANLGVVGLAATCEHVEDAARCGRAVDPVALAGALQADVAQTERVLRGVVGSLEVPGAVVAGV